MDNTKAVLYYIWSKRSLLAYVLLAAAVAYSLHSIQSSRSQRRTDQQKTDFELCQKLNNLNKKFRGLIIDGLKDAEKTAYFQEHPTELANAIVKSKEDLLLFKKTNCGLLPSLDK